VTTGNGTNKKNIKVNFVDKILFLREQLDMADSSIDVPNKTVHT